MFGGAFNPPHRTHRQILAAALHVLPVERAFVLPSGRHPCKDAGELAPDAARLELCRVAFGDLPGVEISAIDLRGEGPAYTVDTVREIEQLLPGWQLFLLVGSDNLRILDQWHDHHELLRRVRIVTWPRRGHLVDREVLAGQDLSPQEVDGLLEFLLEVDADDVSATAIRAALRAGGNPLELAPEVAETIRRLGLYGSS